jgi:hypothetical protein
MSRAFPELADDREAMRQQYRREELAKAERAALLIGRSVACRRAIHKGQRGGCTSDGSFCLCYCHDVRGQGALL